MKRLMTALFVGVSCLVLLGGCSMAQDREREQLVEIATSEEAREVYERTLKNFDEFALTDNGKIKSYEIDESTVERNPMGGLMISLVINDNPQYILDVGLLYEDETEDLRNPGTSMSKELWEFLEE